MSKLQYGIHGRDYLARLRAQMAVGTDESLFYAGLELRRGVESRLHDYADTAAEIMGKKKKGWQIAKLAAGIEQAFSSKETIVELAFLDHGLSLYYTPVRRRLRKIAEIVGEFMHYQEDFDDQVKWLDRLRGLVTEGETLLDESCAGTLKGPLIMKKHADKVTTAMYAEGTFEDYGLTMDSFSAGSAWNIGVRYHDRLPSNMARVIPSKSHPSPREAR